MAMDKINNDDFDYYKGQTICERKRAQPDAVFYGCDVVVIVDWKFSDKNTDHSHQMYRYAKLYEKYGNNCLIWVVSIKNGKILQEFNGQELINKMEAWYYQTLRPHMLNLDRIRREAQQTGR